MFLGNKSLFDLVKDKKRQDFTDASNPMYTTDTEDAADVPLDDPHGFQIGLKKKRRSTMLRQMLQEAGYDDLAKMINIKEY